MKLVGRAFARDARWILMAPMVLPLACTGQIGDGRTDGAGPGSVGAGARGGLLAPGATGTGQAVCTGTAPAPGPSPLRRLTHREYDNTVRDLLGDTTSPATAFAPEEQFLGFDNNAETRGVTSLLAEQYMNAAEQLATRAAQDLPKLMGCTPTDAAARDACANQFIQTFGKRAFRRPMEAAEVTRLNTVYTTGRDKYGFPVAVQLVLQTFLQSSAFLYRVERGASATSATKVVPLGPWELASRLSYQLWASMPDDALLRAAESGQLTTREQVAGQARRMLQDGRVGTILADFHRQWLELDKLDSLEKDATVVPGFTKDLGPLMKTEVETFVDAVLSSDKPDLGSLLKSPFSFMNAQLAGFYGVKGPVAAAFQRVELDPAQRAGILTLGGLLSIQAHPDQTSPVKRGLFVRRQLLCDSPPPPPPNVVVQLPKADPTLSTRDRFGQHSSDAFCKACHQLMDPIGLGFESYDAAGRYRSMENGKPIDSSGQLIATVDIDGKFVGAVDLANRLAGSRQVSDCAVTEWFRYAYGRDEVDDQDACNTAFLQNAFAKSGQNVRELLFALTQTDAFFYRSVPEGESP